MTSGFSIQPERMPPLVKTLLVILASAILLSACSSFNDYQAKTQAAATPQQSAMIEDLIAILEGEFDSRQQQLEDESRALPKKERHAWVNRAYLRVHAPAVGKHVMVVSSRYGPPPWYYAKTEFFALTFEYVNDGAAILMTSWQFKDQETRMPFARDAIALGAFQMDHLEKAPGGGACPIVWTKTEYGFSGRNRPCNAYLTQAKKNVEWIWMVELSDDALEVQFLGTDETGAVLDSPPNRIPYRLDRIPLGSLD